jgi:hypothetical protein
VAPPPVAALFTAFVLVAGAAGTTPIEIGAPALPPTFASAGPNGDGDACRSLLPANPALPFSASFVAGDAGAGDADFLEMIGRVNGGTVGSGGDGLLASFDGDIDGGWAEEEAVMLEDAGAGVGMSNSAGRVRGVACTLVINLARSQ